MKSPLKPFTALTLFSILLLSFLLPGGGALAQSAPVVRAVLFYRSTCSHCVQLVREVLPPILETYGERLQIFYCDVSFPAGDALFGAAIDQFSIKTIGVPTLIVGEMVLIGSRDIEQKFPGLIEAGLAQGGLDWPDIPGLQAAFSTAGSMTLPPLGSQMYPAQLPPTAAAVTTPVAAEAGMTPTTAPAAAVVPAPVVKPTGLWAQLGQNFSRDLRGNSLAAFVLAGMLIALVYGSTAFWKKPAREAVVQPKWARFIVPLLCALGVGISAYLAYVELTLAEALCGPVGDCQAVQSSPYARLAGIPVGLLGVAGYLVILAAWVVSRFAGGRLGGWARLALLGLTTGGLLFSIYLTFLEPFVIGAVCLWCLASAVTMASLFLLSVGPARRIFS